jgi:post-segregation antitoxin (ccd killing protein)
MTEKNKKTKQRLTIQLSGDLLDRAKNAVYWTPGLTLAALAEEGLKRVVERIEKQRGSSFPHRKEELKGGRPII